ncbi:MAG TPA: hypothetical protein VGH28_18490 [Polyangiaceae bacterium]|jgi:hypothetical protein
MKTAALLSIAALAACTRGAPARSDANACGDGLTVALGACVSYRMADAFCGAAAKPEAGGCVRRACGPGEALELDHGICIPEVAVGTTLLHGQPAEQDDKREPTCLTGVLTSRKGKLDCADGPLSCRRGERFVKTGDGGVAGKCEPIPPCGPGELFDLETAKCDEIVRHRTIDVGTWARLALGPDGGEGANAFCAPVRAAGPGKARFQVQIDVPDNDVTRASARLVARPPAATSQADAAERSIEELVRILHFYGGSALAASVSLDVVCTSPLESEPTLELPPEK